jgi:hypothetical protein
LYAKRRARMIAGGKKTIVYKDGRVLEDSRLDRFGERYYLDAGLSAYVEAGKSLQQAVYVILRL